VAVLTWLHQHELRIREMPASAGVVFAIQDTWPCPEGGGS
jgi:hypothetical protein